MSFDVPEESYRQFMGLWSELLVGEFLAHAALTEPRRVLDVGCGTGVLTQALVARYGTDSVAAVDPSEPFVAATSAHFPGLEVRAGVAESLPYADDAFDAALAQLVVHFMSDPVAGLREMARVTRSGGVVAACVWDHAGGGSPLSLFWRAATELDPAAPTEADLPGTSEGHLVTLAAEAGLSEVTPATLTVRRRFATFEDWWSPYRLGVGPLGAYVASLEDEHLRRLEERCREVLPSAPFEHSAVAWSVRARV